MRPIVGVAALPSHLQPTSAIKAAMGSSHDRRKTRRALQEAGLGHLLQLPKHAPPQPTLPNRPLWKRLGTIVIGTVSLISAMVGLVVVLWPWISIQPEFFYNPKNPYSSSFYLQNDGFITLKDLNVTCIGNFEVGGMRFNNTSYESPDTAKTLSHGQRFSISCKQFLGGNFRQFSDGSEFTVRVIYEMLLFHRRQSFTFRLVSIANGEYRWTYVPR